MNSIPVIDEYIAAAAATLIILIVIVSLILKKTKSTNYELKWKEIQKLLSHKSTWNEAVIDADKLLDEVLKKNRFKGKTMGERLVAAQHHITANDMVWFSHKLRNKIIYESLEVTKVDTKRCLLGFWRALKDLGAFNNEK